MILSNRNLLLPVLIDSSDKKSLINKGFLLQISEYKIFSQLYILEK